MTITTKLRGDIRASELEVGDFYSEYGLDDVNEVAERDDHGDTVLITTTTGDEHSYDIDEVLEAAGGTPVGIEGKVTLANGKVIEFAIGDIAGDISYQQWGNVEKVLYCTVPLMDGLVEKIHEDELLAVIR